MSPQASTSRLLINEYPLQVLPSLAVAIGLNEAIFVQQVHYWLAGSHHQHDGRRWVYNTLDDWQAQFPFWSPSTLRRTIDALRARGLLITGNYNDNGAVRTLWYSIDYAALEAVTPTTDPERPFADFHKPSADFDKPFVQNEQMNSSADFDKPFVQNEQMNVNTSTPAPIPSAQNEQMHLLKMNKPFVQNEQMLIEQRLPTETTRDGENDDDDAREKQMAIRKALQRTGLDATQATTIVIACGDRLTLDTIEQWRAFIAAPPPKVHSPLGLMFTKLSAGDLTLPARPPDKALDDKARFVSLARGGLACAHCGRGIMPAWEGHCPNCEPQYFERVGGSA